ncbi:hypothetical protein [Streptomyces longwoodensis]|uniref:hypothetical protein n=1 Tax=Streptomyces longwoodensis TaxID=68231 RepID=UPI002256ECC9|nr:hypothetical protein [Streptomyces longwoodensis]MCX4993797.1 hypothetical protein [Streptomyces longwoodensis]MCX4998083.1 hypothetical protein [Streptomyces longwoodensis]
MSTAASIPEWLHAGGIGAGTWLIAAVLGKAAVDASGPDRHAATPRAAAAAPEQPGPTAPPRPLYPPSKARHAAGPATASTSPTSVQPYRARHSKRPAWN